MKSLAVRCRLCGHDNLFPLKYAGRTLSCAHCGESVNVVESGEASAFEPLPASTNGFPRETGLRRLTKASAFLLAMLCILTLGVIGGGWGGIWIAIRAGFFGHLFAWLTCPAGAFFGLWLAKWIGQGFAHLMSSYRLALWGLLFGILGGIAYWSQSVTDSHVLLLAGDLLFEQWITLSLSAALGGLAVGFVAMLLDALINFTR